MNTSIGFENIARAGDPTVSEETLSKFANSAKMGGLADT